MRPLLLLSLLTLVARNLCSQCEPAFINMDKQTPQLPVTSAPLRLEPQGYYAYTLLYYNLYNKGNGYVQYNIWDGSDWETLKLSFFRNRAINNLLVPPRLVKWRDQFIACGRTTQVDTIKAGKGKYFGLLGYHVVSNNGIWDTIAGCTFDSAFYFSDIYATNDDLYMHVKDQNDQYKGVIFKYDATQSKFVKIIDYVRDSSEIEIIAAEKRLLISKVASINGMATKGFCYIDNGNVKLNAQAPFNTSFIYGMDAANGRIYAFKDADDPTIYEYTDRIVNTRTTKLDIEASYGVMHVSKGWILWMCYVPNTNSHSSNFLCPQQNQWVSIFEADGGVTNEWSSINASRDGLFLLNYKTQKVMELKDVSTSIAPVEALASLIPYPNPANNHISVQTLTQEMIYIYSMAGQLMYSAMPVNGQIEVRMDEWPAGLYLVRCGSQSGKFIRSE